MRRAITRVLLVALLLASAPPARALDLLVNGGFESGDFTGWTVSDLADSSGSFFLMGDTSAGTPLSSQESVGPASGTFYAVSDQLGPGTHALAQTFTVPGRASFAVLSFAMFVNDWSGVGPLLDPSGLDHTAGPNQHARVDILSAGAAPFDTGAGVVASLYLGVDAGPGPQGYTAYAFDLAPLFLDGGTFILRFAEVDNQAGLNQGIDDVALQFTPAPEPATLGLLASGLAGLCALHRRRRLAREEIELARGRAAALADGDGRAAAIEHPGERVQRRLTGVDEAGGHPLGRRGLELVHVVALAPVPRLELAVGERPP
jgi:hypothetical protein